MLKDKGVTVKVLSEKLNISRQALSKHIQDKMLIEIVPMHSERYRHSSLANIRFSDEMKSDDYTFPLA
jgi:hypothetical protein